MDNTNQGGQPGQPAAGVEQKKKVSVKVTCPHCGKDFDTEVEVPESGETPKMAWQ
jgi:hypothetical protein